MQFLPARLVGFFLVLLFVLFFFQGTVLAQGENWKPDSEVTLVGKGSVRAKEFLNWTLNPQNANWVFLTPGTGSLDQIAQFWGLIRNIAYFLTLIVVLSTAFLIITSRGRNFNARRQVFVIAGVFLLITFSFAIIGFIYGLSDTLQNFFLRLPNKNGISSQDLLNVAFPYDTFLGFRRSGMENDEATIVSLVLLRATAITYYVMAGVLILRKIILWFFIILSPIWVLLLPFPLVRNTAKIWVGEFFRWLFYGPLFAVLLAGLVMMWKSGIPLNFTTQPEGTVVYPTAINILLGGPGIALTSANNLNNVDTYAKYLIALLMLWVVIALPFVLLRIFRDALASFFKDDNLFLQKAFAGLYPFLGRPATSVLPPPPVPSGAAGLALRRPMETASANQINISAQVANINTLPQVKTSDIVKYAGLSIPRIQDIAKLEMQRGTITQNQALLKNIAAPTSITNIHERSRFSSIQQELLSRAKRGDVNATTILTAAETARWGKPIPIVMQRVTGARPGAPATLPQLMPMANHIQTVGIDDYEEVKKMWEENYRSGEVPISDKIKSREDWIKQDMQKISSVIELLSNPDEEVKKQGVEQLSVILPFLLLGGFSDQETIIYLKAKLEAAKKELAEIEQKQQEEESKVSIEQKKETGDKPKHMEAEASLNEQTPQTDERTTTPIDEGNKP